MNELVSCTAWFVNFDGEEIPLITLTKFLIEKEEGTS